MQADDGEEASPPSSLTAPLGSEKCTACPVLIPLYWPLHFWLSRSGPGLPATEATASTLEKTTRLGSIFILVHGDDPKVRTTECNNTILRKNRTGWKKRHQKLVFARHYEGWEANQGFWRILSPVDVRDASHWYGQLRAQELTLSVFKDVNSSGQSFHTWHFFDHYALSTS